MPEIVVATISAEGSPEMNELIVETARALRKEGHYCIASHIGKESTIVSRELGATANELELYALPSCKTRFHQARALSATIAQAYQNNVSHALQVQPNALMTMEGDKLSFVPHIGAVMAPLVRGEADIALATRSLKGRAQFPLVQRVAETFVDKYLGNGLNNSLDYTYGPRAFTPEAAQFIANYPFKDWGILTYAIARPMLEGFKAIGVEVPGFPQASYMQRYGSMNCVEHAAWRIMQNLPHLRAVRLAREHTKRSKLHASR